MTNTTTQEQKHVVASPNPRAEGKVEKIEGEAKVTELQPAEAVKASPMKSKKKRTSSSGM